jgi:hypothetical protein
MGSCVGYGRTEVDAVAERMGEPRGEDVDGGHEQKGSSRERRVEFMCAASPCKSIWYLTGADGGSSTIMKNLSDWGLSIHYDRNFISIHVLFPFPDITGLQMHPLLSASVPPISDMNLVSQPPSRTAPLPVGAILP